MNVNEGAIAAAVTGLGVSTGTSAVGRKPAQRLTVSNRWQICAANAQANSRHIRNMKKAAANLERSAGFGERHSIRIALEFIASREKLTGFATALPRESS
ncbi:hypothetical protein [Bradyrhizobium genosp. P]|uniref:hypothetical protein n=1 Tax=Bradyrhizobium genosp. P TaxID=83641 RepID=UPI003CED2BF1